MKIVRVDPRESFALPPKREREIRKAASTAVPVPVDPTVVEGLVTAAVDVLKGIHGRKMAARLRHFYGLCRAKGCPKQPRPPARKRQFFCRGHAHLTARLSKEDRKRLTTDAHLRVRV